MTKRLRGRRVAAVKVNQWLRGWDGVEFSAKQHRRKPLPFFYVLSLSAVELRSLCGIARRSSDGIVPRAADLGIQRQLDAERSSEIGRFVEYGYPWSTLSEAKRNTAEYDNLRKPGWLPTAIVVNILSGSDERQGSRVNSKDLVKIEEGKAPEIVLPYEQWTKSWKPSALPPIEVIDGQHRLWAFDYDSPPDFQLPIVAFHGLDVSWQAYLFWTINIKPKRINPSLAFDLYPLLRTEDWLESAESHLVYRETRSQELTEALWSHPDSPWYDRINMLGERQVPWVSQSAWIRTIMATVVRRWEGRGKRLGGLFGSRQLDGQDVLIWSRAQQAAFLIHCWNQFYEAVHTTKHPWAEHLRKLAKDTSVGDDPAFYGPYSLISTDQGVRGFLHVVNDLCFMAAARLKLDRWEVRGNPSASDDAAVSQCLKSLKTEPVSKFLGDIARSLAEFDWQTSGTPEISEDLRRRKLVFRGSSGYKEIRIQLLEHLSKKDTALGKTAGLIAENV